MDYTTAYQRRKRHAEFAERWEGAVRKFEEAPLPNPSPAEGRGTTPPPSPGRSPSPGNPGEEMVVRPDGKVIKGSEARWSKRAEERFLAELTMTGSVRLAAGAAGAAGFSTTAVYKRRLKDRHFSAAWDAALDTGKARVQAYLVEAATRTFDPDELPIGDERDIPKVSIGEAINIAKLPSREGGGPAGFAKGRWGIEGRTYDETGFDTTPITREEWEEAGRNIVNRLARIRERAEEEERETGRCSSCGQVLG